MLKYRRGAPIPSPDSFITTLDPCSSYSCFLQRGYNIDVHFSLLLETWFKIVIWRKLCFIQVYLLFLNGMSRVMFPLLFIKSRALTRTYFQDYAINVLLLEHRVWFLDRLTRASQHFAGTALPNQNCPQQRQSVYPGAKTRLKSSCWIAWEMCLWHLGFKCSPFHAHLPSGTGGPLWSRSLVQVWPLPYIS